MEEYSAKSIKEIREQFDIFEISMEYKIGEIKNAR